MITRFPFITLLLVALLPITLMIGTASAQQTPAAYLPSTGGASNGHRILSADMPPGYVGAARNAGRTLCPGYFQPVQFVGPEGTTFSLAQSGAFLDSTEDLQAGLLVGGVYRFKITNIPGNEGAELFPTVELIDRTYPPPHLATRHPIRIHLDTTDMIAALDGQMVTRVVYLEDPETATPMTQTRLTDRPIDIAEYQDALEVADQFGRPMAIIRIGSVAPPRLPELMHQFFFGYPVWAPIYAAPAFAAQDNAAQDNAPEMMIQP